MDGIEMAKERKYECLLFGMLCASDFSMRFSPQFIISCCIVILMIAVNDHISTE